ncbi:MAG: GLUG motif-containing protein [Sedimentisphaerales bacterium]
MKLKMSVSKISIIVLLLSIALQPDWAQAKYSGGSGDVFNPYRIGTPADLLALAADVNDYNKSFILTADINLVSSGTFTTAVIAPDVCNGNTIFDGNVFSGTFDGTGHKIINLSINTSGAPNSYLGLFGALKKGSLIKNIGLENVSITGGNESVYIGGLVGKNDATISNCYSKNTIIGGNNSGYIGGLVGDNNSGAISNCYTTGGINSGSNSYNIGGLVGDSNVGTISSCYTRGDVNSGADSYNVGGLVGQLRGGSISKCNSRGDISGEANSFAIGGLVGQLYKGSISKSNSRGNISGKNGAGALGGLVGDNRSTVTNCYATGDVNGGDGTGTLGGLVGYGSGAVSFSYSSGNVTGGNNSSFLGGLAGLHTSTISNCYSTSAVRSGDNALGMGGLTGEISSGTITNCYSVGTVSNGTGVSNIGGLVGENSSSTINYSYFLETSGSSNNNGTPLTGAKMKQQQSFSNWDFFGESTNGTKEIWWINQGVDYPRLNWQVSVKKCTVAAGSNNNSDRISISGQMSATYSNITGGATVIKVTISSADIVNPFAPTFPINITTFKAFRTKTGVTGRYSFSGTDGNIRKSFTYDVKTGRFSFAASNVDLSGLGSPVAVEIEVADYTGTAEVNETIVNGRTVPIPILLMMGVKDVLRVDKCQVKHGKDPNSDQLSVKGVFAVENPDVNMPNRVSEGLVITLGTQTFTIPADKLTAGNGKITFSKAQVTEGGIATGEFNFNLCSFILTIKNAANITASGTIDFGVKFDAFNEKVPIALP